jgi:SAM-dependent methyltransferase
MMCRASWRDGSTLRPFERSELGPVAGLTLVHAQCHFGLDTLSWAREGATVTGFDFSPAAVRTAHELAQRAGLDAEFLQADVYDAIDAIGGRTFDVVYTGIGAIHWLPDIARWAAVMARLLLPGGHFYMAEFHPFASVFADDELVVVDSYFDGGPHVHSASGSYADPDAHTTHNTRVTWNHVLGDVITSLADAGLVIEFLHEHGYALRACWPFLEPTPDRTYRMPNGQPELPLLYSSRARRPSA